VVQNIDDNHNYQANYLFPTLDDAPEEIQVLLVGEHIAAMMLSSRHDDVVLEEDDGIYEKGNKFKSFHH